MFGWRNRLAFVLLKESSPLNLRFPEGILDAGVQLLCWIVATKGCIRRLHRTPLRRLHFVEVQCPQRNAKVLGKVFCGVHGP